MASWSLRPIGNRFGVAARSRRAKNTRVRARLFNRCRTQRLELLEPRTLLSGGGLGLEAAEPDEAIGSTLLADLGCYTPMPFPDPDEGGIDSGLGQAISYDCQTGQVTIHETTEGPFLESDYVSGGLGAVVERLTQTDPGDGTVDGNFTSLTRVDDPELFPWRVNCKLFMNFNGHYYVASGVLIDPMHVLTAGHCVYSHESDEGGWATSITVVPAYEDGAQPYGEAHSVQLHSWTGWTSDESFNHDIGVIDLDRPIGALTSWYGYGYNNDPFFFTGNTFHNPGYPAESPYNGDYMYYWYGNFDYYLGNQVGIFRDGYGGQSGSGAYHIEDSSRYVYAVLSNGASGFENFVRLTESKFEDIRDDYIPDDVPSTFDLIPLNVKVSPATVNSGTTLSSMSYVVHNYSSAAWSGTVNVSVYLSTNDNITTSDTLLNSHSFTHSFGAKGTTTVTVSSLPTIPLATATGDYYIGVIITTSDYDAGNNDTDGWDAAKIHVNHVNQPPVLSGLPDKSLSEDTSLNNTIDLWAYASDPETSDSSLTFTIVGNTNTGCGVSIDSNRYIDITPTANWNGTSDVTIRVTDPSGLYAEDTFRITVTAVNDAPVLSGLPDKSLVEDGSLNNAIDLWSYASDVETADSSLTYTIVANTDTNCGVSIDTNRYIDINPTPDWNGYSDVTIRATDPEGLYSQDTFRITVTAAGDAPVISGLPAQSLNEDTTLIHAIDLWAYAFDAETPDSSLAYALMASTNPNCGVSIDSQRYINIIPTANWYGYSDVTVRVTDPGGLFSEDIFRITVNSVNDTPVLSALPDKSLSEDGTLIHAIDLWEYASDVETADCSLAYALMGSTSPECGVSIDSQRYINVIPTTNWHGYSDVTVRVRDPEGLFSLDTFRITVNPVNDVPVLIGLPDKSLSEDGSLNDTIDLWSYASDVETADAGLTYSIVGNTNENCGVTIDSERYIDINPAANWNGTSDVTIRATDPEGAYSQDTFRITVSAVNDAPVAADDQYGGAWWVTQSVLGNDHDVEGSALTAHVQTGPSHGDLTLQTDGTFSYLPLAGFVGSDSFTYTAYDGSLWSDAATVAISIVPGDANLDGAVDEDDAATLSSHWGAASGITWTEGDFNGDGRINAVDAAIMTANWGTTVVPPSGEESPLPSAPEVLVGPVQASRLPATRRLIRPAVRESASAGNSSATQILGNAAGDTGDTVDELLAGQSLGNNGGAAAAAEAAHDTVLVREYGPQVDEAGLARQHLAWSCTQVRRPSQRRLGTSRDAAILAVDLLLAADRAG